MLSRDADRPAVRHAGSPAPVEGMGPRKDDLTARVENDEQGIQKRYVPSRGHDRLLSIAESDAVFHVQQRADSLDGFVEMVRELGPEPLRSLQRRSEWTIIRLRSGLVRSYWGRPDHLAHQPESWATAPRACVTSRTSVASRVFCRTPAGLVSGCNRERIMSPGAIQPRDTWIRNP